MKLEKYSVLTQRIVECIKNSNVSETEKTYLIIHILALEQDSLSLIEMLNKEENNE